MSKTTKLMNLAAVMLLAAATAAPSVVSANDKVGGDLPPIEAKVKEDSTPKESTETEEKEATEKEADKTDSADSQDAKSEATDPAPKDQPAKETPATEEPARTETPVEPKQPAETDTPATNQDQPAEATDQPAKEDQGKETAQPEEAKPVEDKTADQGEKPADQTESKTEDKAKEEPAKEESKEESKPAEEPAPTGANLDKAIINVNLLDSANETTNPETAYRTVVGGVRRVGVDFDLSGYADKVKDGDYFDLDLPKGFEGIASTIPLKDPNTGKVIGTVKVTEGKARVTLNGITDYVKSLDAEGVKNLKGNFFFEWKATEVTNESKVTFKLGGDKEIVYNNFTVVENNGAGYNGDSENYAKIHGVAIAKAWESPTLNIKTTASHNWTLRVNTNMKDYSVIRIKDKIVNSQFIPESFTLRRGSYDMTKVNFEGDLIKYGIDYTVKFLNNYQEFELAINNVKEYAEKGYYLQYASTAPLSGIKVKNVATMEADGEVKKPNDRYSWTVADVERTSRLTEGGEINLEPWKSVKPLDPEKPVNPNPPIIPDPNTPSSEESSSSSSEESSESSSEESSSSSEQSSESSSSESSTSSEESSESSSSEESSSSSEESSSNSSSEESSSSSEQSSESSSSEESSSSSEESSSSSSTSSEESSESSSESSSSSSESSESSSSSSEQSSESSSSESSTSSEESSESSSESSTSSEESSSTSSESSSSTSEQSSESSSESSVTSEESSSSSESSSSTPSEESSSSTSSESSSEEGSKPTPSKPEQPKKDKAPGEKLPETGEAENTLIMVGVAFLLFAVAAVMMGKAYEK